MNKFLTRFKGQGHDIRMELKWYGLDRLRDGPPASGRFSKVFSANSGYVSTNRYEQVYIQEDSTYTLSRQKKMFRTSCAMLFNG
jgi:hypothetical protein